MVSEEVEKMIGALQALGPDAALTVPDLRKVIQSTVDRGVCSGTIELVRRAQISKSTLSALLRGYKAGLEGGTLLYAMDQQFNLSDPNEGRLSWDFFGAELWSENRG